MRTDSKATDAGSPPSRPRTVSTPDPLAPRLELVGGRGAEGVGRAEDDALAVAHERAGDLADRRRLAGAVDAHHQDDARAPVVPVGAQRAVHVGPEDGDELADQQLPQVGAAAVASTIDWVRSRSTICVVAARPTSAASRVSSTSSQSSSVSFSRASTVSRPRPREDCERARRERSRTSRPADGGGVSKTSPGSGSAGGSSTAGGASGGHRVGLVDRRAPSARAARAGG